MFKKLLLTSSLIFAGAAANAEITPFINADLGYGETDFNNEVFISVGGGIRVHEYVELEVGYNNYDEVGPFDARLTSFSYNINLGGNVSDNVRLFGIFGAERLDVDDTVDVGPFTVDIDESSTETFFGAGAAFAQNENIDLRLKLISHDSRDFTTISIGGAFYF